MKLHRTRRHTAPGADSRAQVLRVVVRGGYAEAPVRGKAGSPVTLLIRREDASPVGERLIVPALGRSVALPLQRDVRIDLGCPQRGAYELRSESGAVRGLLVLE